MPCSTLTATCDSFARGAATNALDRLDGVVARLRGLVSGLTAGESAGLVGELLVVNERLDALATCRERTLAALAAQADARPQQAASPSAST